MDIFRKASEYVKSRKVSLDCRGEDTVYFKVGFYSVSFPTANSWQHEMVCTCQYGSLQGVAKGALCCHKIAVLVFKTMKFMGGEYV